VLKVEHLHALLSGESLNFGDGDVARETIESMYALCRKTCKSVGELDHFRFDEDDLSELHQFQFGIGSTSSISFPSVSEGIPCAVHWSDRDLHKLLEKFQSVDADKRPDYVQDAAEEFKDWLETATQKKKGLFCFYS
jgi:hypothetical protein